MVQVSLSSERGIVLFFHSSNALSFVIPVYSVTKHYKPPTIKDAPGYDDRYDYGSESDDEESELRNFFENLSEDKAAILSNLLEMKRRL